MADIAFVSRRTRREPRAIGKRGGHHAVHRQRRAVRELQPQRQADAGGHRARDQCPGTAPRQAEKLVQPPDVHAQQQHRHHGRNQGHVAGAAMGAGMGQQPAEAGQQVQQREDAQGARIGIERAQPLQQRDDQHHRADRLRIGVEGRQTLQRQPRRQGGGVGGRRGNVHAGGRVGQMRTLTRRTPPFRRRAPPRARAARAAPTARRPRARRCRPGSAALARGRAA